MVNVTAATSFFGTKAEGMWRAGDTRRVSAHRANELIEEGLVIEARDQSEGAVTPAAVASKTGFATATPTEEPEKAKAKAEKPVTHSSLKKEEKEPAKTKEDKTEGETK